MARTETKQFTVYKYSELSEEAREHVKQWYLDGREAWEFEELCQDTLCNCYNLTDFNVEFSLGYCQGDGLNVYGTLTEKEFFGLLEQFHTDKYTDKQKRRLSFYWKYCGNISIPRNKTRYCFDYSNFIDFADDWIDDLEYNNIRGIDKNLIETVQEDIKEIFGNINSVLEKDGYKFFYEVEDEEVEEMADCNKWEFLEDGALY